MKNLCIVAALMCAMIGIYGQETQTTDVKVGDQLVISNPSGVEYQHLNIPRKNFIIKKGGIPNMGTLKSSIVTVTQVVYEPEAVVTFKRSNGVKFFNAYRTLSADLQKALASGELKVYGTN